MIFIVEAIILCALFIFLVMMMVKDPIKTFVAEIMFRVSFRTLSCKEKYKK